MDWSDSELKLITQLRTEAESLKQCFTTFSFQALAVSATVLAATIAAMEKFEAARYIPLPMILLLITVCRIGIYKYASANRNYGYELHLARTHYQRLEGVFRDSDWRGSMRNISWEESCRAWRVVQATMFRRLYRVPQDYRISTPVIGRYINYVFEFLDWRLYHYREDVKKTIDIYLNKDNESDKSDDRADDPYPWFSPSTLAEKVDITLSKQRELRNNIASPEISNRESPSFKKLIARFKRLIARFKFRTAARGSDARPVYAAGSYLRVMMGLLVTMQGLLLLPLALSILRHITIPSIEAYRDGGMSFRDFLVLLFTNGSEQWISTADIVVFWFCIFVIWSRARRTSTRRLILEEGLLSIHSCSITWQAVVLAHYRALSKTGRTYIHYTEKLAEEASKAADNIFLIYGWIHGVDAASRPSASAAPSVQIDAQSPPPLPPAPSPPPSLAPRPDPPVNS